MAYNKAPCTTVQAIYILQRRHVLTVTRTQVWDGKVAVGMKKEDKDVLTKQLHDKFAWWKVLLHDPSKIAKLHRTWTGPSEIQETYDNILYQLKHYQTGLVKSRIHSNRTKPRCIEQQPRRTRRPTPNDRLYAQPAKQPLPIGLVENAVCYSKWGQLIKWQQAVIGSEKLPQPIARLR